jgi:hypothetical protein
MMRPVKAPAPAPKTARRWAIYVGIPLGLAVLAGAFFLLQPEEVRPGKIVVTPSPSVTAELFIDGKPSGPLPPFVHTVAAGSHRIEIRADGYKAFSTRVDVPSGGRPLAIDAQLVSEGPMQVEGMVLTQPKPEPVGEKTEKTDPPPPDTPKKKHLWWTKKTAKAADPEPAPQPPPAVVERPPPPTVVVVDRSPRLRIVTDPPGAEVRVDGKVVGTSPVTTGPLDPGPYHPVIATLEGYAPSRKAAKLDPAGTTEVRLQFEMEAPPVAQSSPAPVAAVGYLTAATKPAARLTIDGRDTGRWTPVPPANPIALPAGAHTIVFETADGRRLEEQLEIEPGKTSRVIRSLP